MLIRFIMQELQLEIPPTMQGRGGNAYSRWVSFWDKFMHESGDFHQAIDIFNDYRHQRQFEHFKSLMPDTLIHAIFPAQDWEELEPKNISDIQMKIGSNWVNPGINNNGSVGFDRHVAKIDRLYPHPTNDSIFFACAGGIDNGGGELFKSVDRGFTWTLLGTDEIPIADIICFAIKSSGLGVGPYEIMFIGLSTGAVYRSVNGGDKWFDRMPHVNWITQWIEK